MLGAGEEVLTDGQGWVDLQHCKTGRLRVHVQLKQHGEQPDLPWPRDQPWLSTIRCRQLPAGDTDLKLKVLLRPKAQLYCCSCSANGVCSLEFTWRVACQVLRQREGTTGKESLLEARLEHSWVVPRRFSQFYRLHAGLPKLGYRRRLTMMQERQQAAAHRTCRPQYQLCRSLEFTQRPIAAAPPKPDEIDVKGPGDVVAMMQAMAADKGPPSDELPPGGGDSCLPSHPMRGVRPVLVLACV